MDQVQPYQVLIPLVMAVLLGVCLLIWDDRPEIAAAIRAWFAARPLPSSDALSRPIAAPSAEAMVAPTIAALQPSPTNPIVPPHNAHNRAVVHCGHIVTLAQATGDDPAQVAAAIAVLARLVVRAKKSDGTPKVGATDAIRHGLAIVPGGSNPLYALARAALQAEIARERGEPPPRDEIEAVTPAGEVIRRDAAGKRYVLKEGQRVPV